MKSIQIIFNTGNRTVGFWGIFKLKMILNLHRSFELYYKFWGTEQALTHPEIKSKYQSLVGGLMYTTICTWPNIAYAAQSLSQFSSNPGPEHLTGVKHVYRYLKGTIDLSITYSGDNKSDITLYLDVDWENNLDNQRSVSGYVSLLSGGAMTWSSKKQPTVALSSMEAKYMVLAKTIK